MIMNGGYVRVRKKTVLASFKISSQNFPGETQENDRNSETA
jgi:hypothetical protein